jgi:Kef-type K+ transport system membrane component KefB
MEAIHIDLLLIGFVAMLAPLLAELPTGFRRPVVALEIVLGILIGPQALNLVRPDEFLTVLSEVGLSFLLFMVGMEIDLAQIAGQPLIKAVGGWTLSFTIALICAWFFHMIGVIQAPPLLVAVALCTTALGVLLPVLRDTGETDSPFGQLILAAAAAGEFGPLVIISVLLIPSHDTFLQTLFVLGFLGAAFAAADLALRVRSSKWMDRLAHTMQSSGQLPVRICIFVQAALVALAAKFGLNVVIGAFAAGLVIGLVSRGAESAVLRQKLDAIGYGFLIPIFFIAAGLKFDLRALWSGPLVPVQIVVLLILFVVVRGAPVLLYKDELAPEDRLPFALYSATGLPLIVIITEIGVEAGVMLPERAAALVSAGMISVLVFPILAGILRGKIARPW